MGEIKIDKGVPLPERKFGKSGSKYDSIVDALAGMEVGDSWLYPGGTRYQASRLTMMARTRRRDLGFEAYSYAMREEEGGVRIWRMEEE